jgi:hypothetical protein
MKVEISKLLLGASDEALGILSHRLENSTELAPFLLDRMSSAGIADICLSWLSSPSASHVPVEDMVNYLRSAHRQGGSVGYISRLGGPVSRRRQLADAILEDPWEMPRAVIDYATATVLRKRVHYLPVSKIAARGNWFVDQHAPTPVLRNLS